MKKINKYLWLMKAVPAFICFLTFFWHGQVFADLSA